MRLKNLRNCRLYKLMAMEPIFLKDPLGVKLTALHQAQFLARTTFLNHTNYGSLNGRQS